MPTYVGLLRAVNLGAHNKVAMADMREVLEELGMQNPRSLALSGNLVFQSTSRSAGNLERLFETAAWERLGLSTEFFVRTASEWNAVVAGNPFKDAARDDPGHLLVMFLKDAPDTSGVAALQKAIVGRERVRADGRHVYIVYPDGIGRSRLTTAVIERSVGTRATGRNWNTVMKLSAMAEGS